MKQNSKKFLVVGVEIEAEINRSKWKGSFNRGSYHDNHLYPLKHSRRNWIIEKDSSVHSSKFLRGITAEFISRPFPIDKWEKILHSFQKAVQMNSTLKRLSLKQILHFNRTCGAHIHLSIWESSPSNWKLEPRDGWTTKIPGIPTRTLGRIVPTLYFRQVRTKLFKRIQTELPSVWNEWRTQYFRQYAQRLVLQKRSYKREQEWNFNPHYTVEFRSMNLNGVSTWTQFFKLWKIVFETLNKCFTEYDPQKAYLCTESISQKFNEDILQINEHIESTATVNPLNNIIETEIQIELQTQIEQVI